MRDAKKSIVDSLARIMKFNYKEIAEDQIILARVVTVYSDILDPETFGTMDCYDEKNKIEIPDIPLNAHINDDGTSGISGKYTFPKVGSDIYLALDIGVNKDVFIPILFSHVDKVYEQYGEEKTVNIIEVDTPDPNKPYDTEETGNSSSSTQSAASFLEQLIAENADVSRVISDNLYQIDIVDKVDSSIKSTTRVNSSEIYNSVNTSTGGSTHTVKNSEIKGSMGNNNGEDSHRIQTNTQINDYVTFQGQKTVGTLTTKDLLRLFATATGSTSKIEITTTGVLVDGGGGATGEPAVMGNTLESLLSQLITEIIAVNVAIPTMVASPSATANLPIIQGQLSTIKNLGVTLK